MPNVDERLASLEARVDRMNDLHSAIAALRGDMNRQFDVVTGQLGDLRSGLGDLRSGLGELRSDMNQRIQALDMKVDRDFTWMVGIQVALMLAVVGAMVGAYFR